MRNGRLVNGQPPSGVLPPPHRTKKTAFGPSDFAGLWPARFVPDYWVNLHDGGVDYWLTPQDHPITIGPSVGTGTTTQTIIETDVSFDHFVIQTVSVVWATGGATPLVDTRNLRLDCQRRDLGAQEQLDAGWVAFSNVFGTGRYPHPQAIPIVLSADSHFQIQLRNRELFEIQVWFAFGAIRKRATRQAQLPI